MPVTLLGGSTMAMTSNEHLTRFNDIGGLSGRYTMDKARQMNGTAAGRLPTSSDQSWNGNIWGHGSLGTAFVAPKRERSRGKDVNQPSKSGAELGDSKTGSGSLLATSEVDSWSNTRSAWTDSKLNKTVSTNDRQQFPDTLCREELTECGIPRSRSFFDALPTGPNYSSREQSTATSRNNVERRSTTHGLKLRDATPQSTLGFGKAVDSGRSFGVRLQKSTRAHAADDVYELWTGASSHGTPTEELGNNPMMNYYGASSDPVSLNGGLPPSQHGLESASRYAETENLSRYAPSHMPQSARAIYSEQVPPLAAQPHRRPHIQISHASPTQMIPSFDNMTLEDNLRTMAPFKRGSTIESTAMQMYARPESGYSRQALADISQNVLRPDQATIRASVHQPSNSFARNRLSEQFGKQGGFRNDCFRYDQSGEDEYLRNLNSPYPGPGGVPLAALEHPELYQIIDRPPQALTNDKDVGQERRLRGGYQQQPGYFHAPCQPIMTAQFPDPYGQRYSYGLPAGYQTNGFAQHFPVYAMAGMLPPPLRSPKALDSGQSLRSALLEEFKGNAKTSKRYELRDIYDHIVEFSGDQHGSRFIQLKLETANSDEKERVFREIQTNAMQLMTDVFGNYVIQKFFEHGDQNQKKVLANRMKGQVLSLSLQMYGCRVVQKALEHVLTDQQEAMVRELENNVIKCVKDQNGNHVIQKAIERVPAEHIDLILNSFTGRVGELAIHPYGCRVIQRLLERCQGPAKASILQELHVVGPSLISDQYGNYVTQHIIEQGGLDDRAKVLQLIKAQLLTFSKHKFASNVVEKALVYGTEEQRMEIVAKLAQRNERGETELVVLIKDQYGNYVIQKLLDSLNPINYARFLDMLYPEIAKARRLAYGKQVQSIEKKMHRFDGMNFHQHAIPSITTDFSGAPTPRPSLSDGQSPRSNSLPSTNTSTADGPVHSFNNPI